MEQIIINLKEDIKEQVSYYIKNANNAPSPTNSKLYICTTLKIRTQDEKAFIRKIEKKLDEKKTGGLNTAEIEIFITPAPLQRLKPS